jgi:hypothetical protein
LVTSNVTWLRGRDIDFFAPVDDWTPDHYIAEFWGITEAYVASKYARTARTRNGANIGDLQGVGLEALVNFSRNDFFPWCEENNKTATDKRLFWAMAKRAINWRIGTHLEKNTDQNDSVNALEEMPTLSWMRTNFKNHVDASSVQGQMVDKLEALPIADQVMLALYHFEEMTLAEVGVVIGVTMQTVRKYLALANSSALYAAISVTTELTPQAPALVALREDSSLTEWVEDMYHADVASYLQYVAIHYRADVRYLVDMLSAANGNRVRNGHPEGREATHTAQFTDEQIRDIRTRLAAGEKQGPLASQYQVTDSVISRIKNRHAYAYVKDAA